MSVHTPGPWKCISDSSYGISVVDEKGRRIAWCGTGLPPIKPRAIDTGEAANARLITSAPELVRELKRLHRQRVKNRVAWGIPCGDLEKTDILIDAAEGGRKYPCNRIDGANE